MTPMFDYYKAWDKFAGSEEQKLKKQNEEGGTDSEDEVLEAKQAIPDKENTGPMSQAEMMKRTSGARPNTKLVIKGGTIKKSG